MNHDANGLKPVATISVVPMELARRSSVGTADVVAHEFIRGFSCMRHVVHGF
jgi:hypothetical protein